MNKECNLLGVWENAHTFQFLLPQMNTFQGIFVQHRADYHRVTMERNGERVKDQEGHWQVCRSKRHPVSVCVIQGVQQELPQEMQPRNCKVLMCVAQIPHPHTSLW